MTDPYLVGREREVKMIDRLLASDQPEFLVVYGRRRVGKTFLIRQKLKGHLVLDFTGARDADMDTQLSNFFGEYIRSTAGKKETTPPKNWSSAFQYLADYLNSLRHRKRKIVVFFDELPWMDTPRSGFISALEYFWNQHGSKMNNFLFIGCGSAASWMHKKLLKAKGGLHNRVTQRLHLRPFTLSETELYCKRKKLKLTRYQIIQLYMAMGGVPFYLRELSPGKSVAQLIDEICFHPDGRLSDEYNQLYHSLFKNAEDHMAIIEALATKPYGLTRDALLKKSKLPDGGSFTRATKELIDSGFIDVYQPFGRIKKGAVYKLIDLYTLFYLKFIKGNISKRANTWQSLSSGGAFNAWSGYAFENICILHIDQILQSLGIGGLHADLSSWYFKGNQELRGAQVDLVIDRKDGIIHLCEAKFSKEEFVITKDYIKRLRHKRLAFQHATKSKKSIVTTLLTTYPAIQNKYYLDEIHTEISMDALFG